MSKKQNVDLGRELGFVEGAADELVDRAQTLIDAARDLRLRGSLEQLRTAQRAMLRAAREAAQCALTLASDIAGAERDRETEVLRKHAGGK